MSIEKDILDEINELLGKAEPAYGPETLEARPIDRPPPAPRPPKVGTTIQRSDRENRIKAAMLATPPPPLASCRRRRNHPPPPSRPRTQARAKEQRPDAAPSFPTPEILVPMGPAPPPPIMVELEPGLIAPVPHFAVHVSRRYKIRLPQGQWTLRFSADGKLRYRRKMP
ncbi:hypothetical protein ACFW04_006561 [Cataglyphis niger]